MTIIPKILFAAFASLGLALIAGCLCGCATYVGPAEPVVYYGPSVYVAPVPVWYYHPYPYYPYNHYYHSYPHYYNGPHR